MATDPDELDANLRSEADRMLAAGLRDALSEYGELHVVGSYSSHLMAWRDLDIVVVREPIDRPAFFALGHRIVELLGPPRMQYRDEVVARTPGLPAGLYWGVHLGDARKGAWKIDIWSVGREYAESLRSRRAEFEKKLSSETRRVIIALKSRIWADPRYRREFSSQDLYDCVLTQGVRDVEGLWQCLSSKKDTG